MDGGVSLFEYSACQFGSIAPAEYERTLVELREVVTQLVRARATHAPKTVP
jgi:hypothetical protein